MGKFTPYSKLSKKEQKKQNQAQRNTWGPIKPVTRKVENAKVYNRKKLKKLDEE